jgi:hypothetical protein
MFQNKLKGKKEKIEQQGIERDYMQFIGGNRREQILEDA